MRAIATMIIGLMVTTPSFASRKTVSIGDELVSISVDRRDDEEVAETKEPIDRKANLVARIRLAAGTQLERMDNGYCSSTSGYISGSDDEYGICLHDRDGDGRFELITGGRFPSDEFKLKAPVQYQVKRVTLLAPSRTPRRIIYLGGNSSEAKFSYREFTMQGLARPAFTEDLTVPLSSFPVSIALKGIKMVLHGQSAAGLDVEILE